MDRAALNAITDIQTLHAMVMERDQWIASHQQILATHEQAIATREQTILCHERTLVEREARIALLEAENARLRRLQFAARSEKMDLAQRALFEETLAEEIAAVEATLAEQSAPVAPTGDTGKNVEARARARRELPAHLERVENRHELTSCTCSRCGGALVHVGDHISEKLACKPLEFFVRREVYPQYACRACETMMAEPVAPAIIDRGIATPELLAQVIVAKYVDHLPLYRQSAIYARSGIELSRTTLAEWIGACGVALSPLADRLQAKLKEASALHADETPVGMLDPGNGQTKRAYLFAYRTAVDPPIVLFDFATRRSGEHVRRYLGDWRGHLRVDDYGGYKALFGQGVTELGCWAHARRKFFEQHQASGSPIAGEALVRIAALYEVEKAGKDLDAEARRAWRQQHAQPLLAAFRTWLDAQRLGTLGNSGTAKAIDYTLKRWPALIRYVDDGNHPIDNNPIENAIRPIALGRKNGLFVGAERAGHRAAAIMGLLATAKANGLEPQAWLTDVLTRLPTTRDRDIDTLLPLRA